MKCFLTIVLVFIACVNHAQTLAEWTQQKKTQLVYLANQISALQVYATYVEKGYSIAKKGLDAIQNIKKGDFSMHASYFNSLKSVNPKIKNYWKVTDIIALQLEIVKTSQQQRKSIQKSGQFTGSETNYYNRVITNLLDGCTAIIDQLILLVTNGNTQMSDGERIKRIDGLYVDVKDKYEFEQHFSNETKVLAMQRYLDVNDLKTSRALWNINE